jgi:GxxExxY protein
MRSLQPPSRPKFEGKHSELSERILEIFFKVYHELGYGFNERVYQKALVIALHESGFAVEEQKAILVYFHGELVGEYYADLVINGLIMLELKATQHIIEEHEAQLLNYLKASDIEVGFVLNFGPTARFARKVYDNERKGTLSWVKRS